MDKRYIVGIENFKSVENAIIADATDTAAKNGGVVYARILSTDEKTPNAILIAGNLLEMIKGIAKIINMISEKTGVPRSIIISKLIDQVLYKSYE